MTQSGRGPKFLSCGVYAPFAFRLYRSAVVAGAAAHALFNRETSNTTAIERPFVARPRGDPSRSTRAQ